MEIKVLDTNNPTQLAIIGRVDTVTADEFLKTMESILQEHPQDMEWDCTEWKFLSSAGLRVLFILVKKTKMLKATITLKHLEKNVYEVLKISVLVIGLLRFSTSSWFSCGKLYFSKNLSISSKLSILFAYSFFAG